MTEKFEGKHGFPPGINQVLPADVADQEAARAPGRDAHVAVDPVAFYGGIGAVVWEDVGNGCFIHPARGVLEQLAENGAVRVGEGPEPRGLVIGPDGGGLSYVIGPEGSIHRTRTASLDEPEADKVADDLRQFLESLERSPARFLATGEPGYFQPQRQAGTASTGRRVRRWAR
ncbi:SMI1/KNR4 family protein [Streptomyces sp. NPDC003077]|uniref:SMI1/KNR4 family protein n=1 Tax=Streptomyces sp. NPDC003077 TaxID=3154443 RepID=UPI0033B49439